MTKYRPVEGRSINDVRTGDFVAGTLDEGEPAYVVSVHHNECWLSRDHHGWIESDMSHWQIVEPIPEPKIEVSYHTYFVQHGCTDVMEAASIEDAFDGHGDELAGVIKLTRTDGKITAVELIREAP